MLRWFEQKDTGRPGVISSRIRLVRNWQDYRFPAALDEKESSELVHRLEFGLKDLGKAEGKNFEFAMLGELEELDRVALKERRVLNSAAVSNKKPAGILISENEDTGIVLNCDDHIRIQLLQMGLHLEELWERADRIDDYINERFPYAFDDRYGYLTSFPTNMGTGLRASVVVHLPCCPREESSRALSVIWAGLGLPSGVFMGKGMRTLVPFMRYQTRRPWARRSGRSWIRFQRQPSS